MIAAANPPEGFETILSSSPFGWANGPIFERKIEEGVERGFRVAARHINAGGALHGGMVMTFADILLATAVHAIATPPLVTLRLTTDFEGPAFEGEWVEGRAEAEPPQDGIIAVRGLMSVGERPVAAVQGLFKEVGRRPK